MVFFFKKKKKKPLKGLFFVHKLLEMFHYLSLHFKNIIFYHKIIERKKMFRSLSDTTKQGIEICLTIKAIYHTIIKYKIMVEIKS